MTIFFLNLQITRSDIRPHIKWAVSLLVAYGHFNLPRVLVWVCMGKYTYFITPRGAKYWKVWEKYMLSKWEKNYLGTRYLDQMLMSPYAWAFWIRPTAGVFQNFMPIWLLGGKLIKTGIHYEVYFLDAWEEGMMFEIVLPGLNNSQASRATFSSNHITLSNKVGSQPGDCRWLLSIFLKDLCGYVWVSILILSPLWLLELAYRHRKKLKQENAWIL